MTASVIGALRVNLGLDSAQFQKGVGQARVQTQQLQRSFTGFNARGISQQLSQVGQQTMATGNFVQALAIQLPDLGLAFGAVGTAVGLLAGIALPTLVAAFGGADNSAKGVQDQISALDTAIKDATTTVRDMADSAGEMARQFGGVNTAFMDLVSAQVDISIRNLAAEASTLRDELVSLYNGNAWLNVSRAEELYRAFELAGDGSRILTANLEALRDAETLDDQVSAATALRSSFEDMVGPVGQMTEDQFSFYTLLVDTEQALIRTQGATEQVAEAVFTSAREVVGLNSELSLAQANMGNVAGAAWGIATALGAAVRQAAALRTAQAANTAAAFGPAGMPAGVASGLDPAPPGRPEARPGDIDFGYTPVASSGGRSPGGGGSSPVDDLADAYKRLLEQLDPVVRASNELAEQQDTLNRALEAGITDQAGYASAMALAQEEYDDAIGKTDDLNDAMSDLRDEIGDGLGDALGQFIKGGMKDFDGFAASLVSTFSDAIAKMVAEAATARLGQALGGFAGPVGGILGSIAGGLLGGLFGPKGQGPKAQARAAAEQRQAEEQYALNTRLLELQGKQNQLDKRELETMEPANRELAKRVMMLEQEAAIAAERESLEYQLLVAQGDTAALRELELAALDESNRALQEQIWAVEDQAAAAQEAAAAADEAAAALDALVASVMPEQFATLFDFQKAQAAAMNGFGTSGVNAVPILGAPGATGESGSNVISLEDVRNAIAKLETTTAQIGSQLLGYEKTQRDILRQWNGEGMPPVRA